VKSRSFESFKRGRRVKKRGNVEVILSDEVGKGRGGLADRFDCKERGGGERQIEEVRSELEGRGASSVSISSQKERRRRTYIDASEKRRAENRNVRGNG